MNETEWKPWEYSPRIKDQVFVPNIQMNIQLIYGKNIRPQFQRPISTIHHIVMTKFTLCFPIMSKPKKHRITQSTECIESINTCVPGASAGKMNHVACFTYNFLIQFVMWKGVVVKCSISLCGSPLNSSSGRGSLPIFQCAVLTERQIKARLAECGEMTHSM